MTLFPRPHPAPSHLSLQMKLVIASIFSAVASATAKTQVVDLATTKATRAFVTIDANNQCMSSEQVDGTAAASAHMVMGFHTGGTFANPEEAWGIFSQCPTGLFKDSCEVQVPSYTYNINSGTPSVNGVNATPCVDKATFLPMFMHYADTGVSVYDSTSTPGVMTEAELALLMRHLMVNTLGQPVCPDTWAATAPPTTTHQICDLEGQSCTETWTDCNG